MLAKPNRVVRAADFRATMRTGRRVTSEHAIVYVADREPGEASRFGFVVARSVGNAVVRNHLRRQLRAIAHELVSRGFGGADVVVRALPGIERVGWDSLHGEISLAIMKGARR
jgi:ribonuclease P protein component